MSPFCRRIQFHEIGDQRWLPRYLHAKFQDFLTLYWTFHLKGLQPMSPAAGVASILSRTLSSAVRDYTYVDFCAGAGGPSAFIEKTWNDKLDQSHGAHAEKAVKFILTDLHPHIPAWSKAVIGRSHLSFVEEPVDATDTPSSLASGGGRKIFRLYNLAFHHFNDELASSMLRETLDTADGFGIFELQERTFVSLANITLFTLLSLVITPFYFWRSPGHMIFTYLIPLIPFIVLYDGYVSALRTRTPEEILSLVNGCSASSDDWSFVHGHDLITSPTGYMTWFVGVRKQKVDIS